ncbi:hypothetical protein F5X96DRAFT_190542 [Biscogniauxia mediterranea]|nr:hypothetical protein F5X96DRAFT_190542 [Biscogniauxia mediterranea]
MSSSYKYPPPDHPSTNMEISTEAIIAILALLVSCPPSLALLWSWAARRNVWNRRARPLIRPLSSSRPLLGQEDMLSHTSSVRRQPERPDSAPTPYLRRIHSCNIIVDVESGIAPAQHRRGMLSLFNLSIIEGDIGYVRGLPRQVDQQPAI